MQADQPSVRSQSGAMSRKVYPILSVGLVLLLLVSAWASWMSGRRADRRIRDGLLRDAVAAASLVSPEQVQQLSFTIDDLKRPVYHHLCHQLRRHADAIGRKSVYTMALRDDGKLVFGPESLTPESPGDVYRQPADDDFVPFRESRPVVMGPVRYEYGTFVSALAPVIHPRSGQVLAVVGVDLDAAKWRAELRRSKMSPLIYYLIPIIIVVGAGALVRVRESKFEHLRDKFRHIETVACSAVMIFLTVASTLFFYEREDELRRADLRSEVQSIADFIRDEFRELDAGLVTMATFFEASELVTRDEFATFGERLTSGHAIEAYFWAPRLPVGSDARFSELAVDAGYGDVSVRPLCAGYEPGPSDGLYPVLYVEPLADYQHVLGCDINSEARRRVAIAEALRSGRTVATDPIELIGLPGAPRGVFCYHPVSAAKQQGVVGIALRPDVFLRQVADRIRHTEHVSFDLSMVEMIEGGDRLPISAPEDESGEDDSCLSREFSHPLVLIAAFRRMYAIEAVPRAAWREAHPLLEWKVSLCVGLLVTVLVTFLVASLVGRPVLLRRLVEARTQELTATSEKLDLARREAEFIMKQAVLSQKKFQKSEEQYRMLFNNMTSGFALHEMLYDKAGVPVDYRFLQINPAFEKLTGLKQDECIGRTAREVLPEIEQHWIDAYGRVTLTGEPAKFTQYTKALDRHFVVRAFRPFPDHFAVVFVDVTERVNAEEDFRRASREWQLTFDASNDAIFLLGSDNTVQRCNEAAQRLFERTHDDIVGKHCWEVVHNSDKPFPGCPAMRDKRSLVRETMELELGDGWFNVVVDPIIDDSGEYAGAVHTLIDLTDRKLAEQELIRLSTAIEQSPESVVITSPDGTIEYVNPAFEAITGYRREEVMGTNPRVLQSGRHDDAFYKDMWDTIQGGDTWEGRIVNKRKDGTLYTEEASIAPVRDPSGKITGYVAIKRDISDELAHEELIQQSQKMRAVGQLAGGVAHDFNNVLQSILGFAELLGPVVEKDAAARGDLREIEKEAHRAAGLTKQLLAFSRTADAVLTPTDMNGLIGDSLRMLTSVSGESVRIKTDLNASQSIVRVDVQQFERVLMNLTINARDAMPQGGELTIATENVSFSARDQHVFEGVHAGDFLCVVFSDTGVGIPDEVMPHIFEPFFTTKEKGHGTGLGLAATYGIVTQHGGAIQAYSEEGQGAVFKVYLPLAGDDDGGSVTDSVSGKSSLARWRGNGERVLVVEDNASILSFASRALSAYGYEVEEAACANDARSLFEGNESGFDVLFSDVILPDENGPSLAASLLKEHPDLGVLLASGYSGDYLETSGLSSHEFDFLEKPYSLQELIKAVHRVISRG